MEAMQRIIGKTGKGGNIMGFFDRKVENGFDEMFDFNRDGVLDLFE